MEDILDLYQLPYDPKRPLWCMDEKLTAADGSDLEHNEREVVRRVISDETSAQIRKYLTGVVDSGSGKNAAVPGYSVGGKTGTSQKIGRAHV